MGRNIARLTEYVASAIDWTEDQIRTTSRSSSRIAHLHPREVRWSNLIHSSTIAGTWFFGGRRISKNTNAHTLLGSTTRAGKTSLLCLLMQDVLPDVLQAGSNVRAVIYDPKQEMYDLLAGMGLEAATVLLDPFDQRSFAWDMQRDIRSLDDARLLAATLVPRRDHEGGNEFFTSVTKLLFEHTIFAFITLGKPWTFRHVLEAMADDQRVEMVASISPGAKQALRRVFEGRKGTLKDVLMTITDQLEDYRILASLWNHAMREGKSFSIAEWHTSQRILLLPPPRITPDEDASADATSCLNRLLFTHISRTINSLPEAALQPVPPKMWIIIDELRFAGKLPGLDKLLTQGASKGARVMLAFQDISGLRQALGKESAEEIASLCANQAFLRAGNAEMADWMARQFGKERIKQPQVTITDTGRSTTYQPVDRPVLLDTAFLNLPLPTGAPMYRDLEGYFRTAEHGCWRARLSAKYLFTQALIPPRRPQAGEPADHFRPADQQILEPWTAADSKHFGIHVAKKATARVKLPPRLSKLGLFEDPKDSD